MPTNIYCENEECTYCINGVCEKTAVKVNFRGKCESLQLKEPSNQAGGSYEKETV